MKSVCLLLCALVALAESNYQLACYSCSGKGSKCPEPASISDVNDMDVIYCPGVLATACTKYTVKYLDGEAYTFRSCAPAKVDAVSGTGLDFCTFIKEVYAPLTDVGDLVKGVDCTTCGSVTCNS